MGSAIRGLVGTWRGGGTGAFPTMDPFTYEEEVTFLDLGVAPIMYRQRAWSPEDRELLHLETGLWRPGEDGRLAVTIALPRVTEVSEGRIEDGRIELVSTSVARADGGAGLVAVRRSYDLGGNSMSYEISMATEEVGDVTHHLAGALRRVATP